VGSFKVVGNDLVEVRESKEREAKRERQREKDGEKVTK